MRATWLAAVLTAISSTAAAQTVPVTLTRAELEIRLDYENRTLSGAALMRLRNLSSAAVSEIPMQLGRLMAVEAVRTEDNAHLSFTQDIVRFSDWPQRQMNQLYVRLPRPLAPGDSLAVRVSWNGTLVGYTETGMGYVRERIDTAFTILRSETGAFPVIAVPNEAANRAAPRGEFEYVARITVPSRQAVALGGELVSTDKRAGLTTWQYRSIKPAAFINIAIAPYEVMERDALRIFFFPSDSAGALQLQAALHRALALLTRWFGPMGDSLPVIVTEIPNGYGSQASLYSGIILEARAFNDPKRRGELYHELSHLWNAPDQDVPSPRWNEGLAGFMEDLLMEQLDNWKGRHDYTQKYAMQYLDRFAKDSVNLRTPMIDYGRTGRTDLAYGVGYFMFYVLYETIGADAFNRAIGGYYQQHRLTGATTEQFISHLREHSPVDLTSLVDDWVYSVRWYRRLRAGLTLRDMAADYRTSVRSTTSKSVEPFLAVSSN